MEHHSHSLLLPRGQLRERSQYFNNGGFTEFTTMRWRRGTDKNLHHVEFLITRCKRRLYERHASEWRRGESQLGRYLRGFKNGLLYGIIAIGKLVVFTSGGMMFGTLRFGTVPGPSPIMWSETTVRLCGSLREIRNRH